jgi:adenylate cyclase
MNRILLRRARATATFTVLGLLAGLLLGVVLGRLDVDALPWPALRGLVIGGLIGTAVGVGEEVLVPLWSRRLSFRWLNAVRLAGYVLAMVGSLVGVNTVHRALVRDVGVVQAGAVYLGESPGRDLVAALVAAAVLIPLLQLKRLHSAGELWRLVTGRYHYPEEEERIFLFVDLVDSTTHAERLGALMFSAFLRDLFRDVSEAILAWRGQVYQHLGDGVIISWPWHAGVRGASALRCYFEMARALDGRSAEYVGRYGVKPLLRGGLHGGTAVVTWVGEAKRELAFHGDTLNAAARIQSQCKDLGVSFLVSSRVLEGLPLPGDLTKRSMGSVELRGRSEPVTLFAVHESGAPSPRVTT